PATEPAPRKTPVRTLRLRIGLLGTGRGLPPSRRRALLWRGRGVEISQTALEVVEDEPDGRLRLCCRSDQAVAVPHDEDAAAVQRALELRDPRGAVRRATLALCFRQQRLGFSGDVLRALLIRKRRADDLTAPLEDDGGADLRGDLPQARESGGGVHTAPHTRRNRSRCRPDTRRPQAE